MAEESKALDVLSQALKLEQEGKAFYLQAADLTDDEQGKAMFLSLADDEVKHAGMITRQLHAIEGDGAYVLLPDLNVEAVDASAKLFPPEKKEIEAALGVDPNIIDALHLALEREVLSRDLYAKAAQETQDKAGKQMYLWLVGAETTHFNLLMANYQALTDRGGWV
jgi:rubrerythrin